MSFPIGVLDDAVLHNEEHWVKLSDTSNEGRWLNFGPGSKGVDARRVFVQALRELPNPRRPISMSHLKEYFTKYRDTLLTIGLVVVLDHFIFQGAFRSKIQKAVEKLLDGKVS